MGGALNGHLTLFHRFQQRALRSGRGTIHFIGEHNLGEQVYRQQIKISTVGTTSYVDEGNRVD